MIDPPELARHIDRTRRWQVAFRPSMGVRDLPNGWLCAEPNTDSGETASGTRNRVYWHAPTGPISVAEIAQAAAGARELGLASIFVWLAPWACDAACERALFDAGAVPVPDVRFIALARPAAPIEPAPAPQPAPATSLRIRRVHLDEAPAFFDHVRPWYWPTGADTALRQMQGGLIETYGAFDADTPVALGLLTPDVQTSDPLTPDAKWAYLGSALTRPDARGRGAQRGLIAARVARAAELGAAWCASEINTTTETSLRNLRASGFTEVIEWRVFRWMLPASHRAGDQPRPSA
ncbi:MAG: GNAT family N-acetyltransferase [Planctomycetota bacterium]|nr:GNAT family N-acetyltransferase [Planctomycetota bacterium]